MVSPFTTRTRFTELIDAEIRNARKGDKAWMILKMLSETPKDESKKYASICIQSGFVMGGEVDE